MLKKSICVVLHIAATVVICITLLIGALQWGMLGARSDILIETGPYEYSGICWLDAMNDIPMLWEYLDTKRFLYGFDGNQEYPSMGHIDDTWEIENPTDMDRSSDLSDRVVYQIVLEADMTNLYESLMMNMEYLDSLYTPENSNLRYILFYNGEILEDTTEQDKMDDLLMIYEDDADTGYTLKLYLDTTYPVEDYFSQRANAYNEFQYLKKVVLVVTGCMLGLCLILTIMLTVFAGRTKEQKEVVLSWIDRPPLELVLLFWTGVAGCVVAMIVYSASNSYYEASYTWIIISGFVAAIGDAMAMTGYLSLVRRIKSRTFWKNSLCYRIITGVRRVIRNLMTITRVSQRWVFICGIYIVLMLCCCFIHTKVSLWIVVLSSITGIFFVYRDAVSRQRILEGMEKITQGELDHQIDLREVNMFQMEVAQAINQIGTVTQQAVNQSMKDEHLKADLITNVSHDIKTPLTSIINYVDLLKREEIQDEKVQGYLEILDQKSQRLKQLTEDLVEASKLSSGNVELDMQKMDFNEILIQALGEFEEKFDSKNLQVILKRPEGQVAVMGEGRRIWRILENLFQNIYKYAMPGTRVYAELVKDEEKMVFTLKNISEHSLNIAADELTERFIRGDVSRTTEGSGLGLSIARDLTTLQKGSFHISLDGDLFKVILTFDLIQDMEQKIEKSAE